MMVYYDCNTYAQLITT